VSPSAAHMAVASGADGHGAGYSLFGSDMALFTFDSLSTEIAGEFDSKATSAFETIRLDPDGGSNIDMGHELSFLSNPAHWNPHDAFADNGAWSDQWDGSFAVDKAWNLDGLREASQFKDLSVRDQVPVMQDTNGEAVLIPLSVLSVAPAPQHMFESSTPMQNDIGMILQDMESFAGLVGNIYTDVDGL